MKGSPLLVAAIAFLILLSLGWPLWQMTRADAPAPPAPTIAAATGQSEIHLQLTFTAPPKSLKVFHLMKEIWSADAPASDIERDLKLAYPGEGIDLRFLVEWPSDAPLASLRVRLTDPAGQEHEKGIWSKGPADEVLTFP